MLLKVNVHLNPHRGWRLGWQRPRREVEGRPDGGCRGTCRQRRVGVAHGSETRPLLRHQTGGEESSPCRTHLARNRTRAPCGPGWSGALWARGRCSGLGTGAHPEWTLSTREGEWRGGGGLTVASDQGLDALASSLSQPVDHEEQQREDEEGGNAADDQTHSTGHGVKEAVPIWEDVPRISNILKNTKNRISTMYKGLWQLSLVYSRNRHVCIISLCGYVHIIPLWLSFSEMRKTSLVSRILWN